MAKKILIIEDDADLVKLLVTRLEANGYETLNAPDGSEGLKVAEEQLPDLILLDIKMPQVDGYTAFRGLKNNKKTRKIPVIVITAYDKLKDLFSLEEVKDYVVKPFEDKDLLPK